MDESGDEGLEAEISAKEAFGCMDVLLEEGLFKGTKTGLVNMVRMASASPVLKQVGQ